MTTTDLPALGEGEASEAGQEPAGGADSSSTSVPPAALTIVVYGHPAPQGSKRHLGRGVMVESSKHVKPWREAVKGAALAAGCWPGGTPYTPMLGPIHVEMTFTFHRPKGHYRTGRNHLLLKDSAPDWPAGTPDLSKLVRSTEDALTDAGVWRDDAQAVSEYTRKVYAGTDHPDALDRPGAVIRITPLAAP